MDILRIEADLAENGYATVRELDVSSIEKARAELLGLLEKLGVPVRFFGQPMIMDIKPQPGFQPASSGGQGYFDLHTDLSFHPQPPKLLGMLCISTDDKGGDTFVADGKEILRHFPQPEQLRDTLVTFPVPSHVTSGPVTQPILTGPEDDPVLRYRSDLVKTDDPAVTELLRMFSHAAHRCMQVFRLQVGEAWIYDNHRVLHGRTEITANPSRRHLLRGYANRSSS